MSIISKPEQRRFWILVIIVSISGFSQGMLLPLISAIFERDGLSSALNGLNATGLYIGTLLISPFMEAPLRKYGYKPVIVLGGIIVFSSLLLFPLWKNVIFWFILRLLIGIGDHALHFSTQTWITSTSPQHRLGRNIAIYGVSFSFGFAAGPLFAPLVNIFEGLPFIVSGLLCMMAWLLVFTLKNDHPEVLKGKEVSGSFWKRSKVTIAIAWIAFLGPFGYGFLESSLNAMYPVYALRNGLELTSISFILATFSIGGISSQIPLGILSDKIGRHSVVLIAYGGGAVAFWAASQMGNSVPLILLTIFIAGLFVGSIFSLGISYMSDLAPKDLLPTGNLLCGIFFSLGSLTGPFAGGLFLEYVENVSYLLIISILFGVLFLISLVGKTKRSIPS
ncbi:putative MFS-type transporter YfkF [Sporosarcina luteola]|uniref:Putative MFS-type transporter YfkF n=1 Tax=Sporosarcina luteola TaxID=582850 RepID=A0A511ZCG6_9BACL|nr:MFS transporter [Sporosarcina luteola]GEN85144.1 putative MFS-type transporter YfkF [Sporosarcina luteola]